MLIHKNLNLERKVLELPVISIIQTLQTSPKALKALIPGGYKCPERLKS